MRTGLSLILGLAISGAAWAQEAPATQPAPAPAAAERVPHPAPEPGEIRTFTIKELGNFVYDSEAGGTIPDDVKRLSGSTVRIKGYMMPLDQADRMTSFVLVPSPTDCCYGQPPQIQHMITVRCPPGRLLPFYPDEISCEGVLNVEEKRDGEWIISVFDLSATSVKSAK